MPLSIEERPAFFESKSRDLILRYRLRVGRTQDVLSALRIGHLMSEIGVKMFGAQLGTDCLICFRDWALENKIHCDPLTEIEEKDGKRVNPFYNPTNRVYDQLDFKKYFKILEGLVCPSRTPLVRRTPIISSSR